MLTIATLNCNGIRASLKKGLADWITQRDPDILCLQEVRAFPQDLGAWADRPAGRYAAWRPGAKPGYAGVAILSRKRPDSIRPDFGDALFDSHGRWLEADFGPLTVVSLYLHTGSSEESRQQVKYAAMDKLYRRLGRLRRSGRDVVVAGDVNIAHTVKDIRNWRSNQKSPGFLPEERAWVSKVLGRGGWSDVFRLLDDRDGRYTWWSQRSAARAKNVGWRIDYQLATPAMAARASECSIDKDPILSDHAPLIVSYRRKQRQAA